MNLLSEPTNSEVDAIPTNKIKVKPIACFISLIMNSKPSRVSLKVNLWELICLKNFSLTQIFKLHLRICINNFNWITALNKNEFL